MATWLVLLLVGLTTAQDFDWDQITALDEYCSRDDGAFAWGPEPIDVFDEPGAMVYTYNMTSQIWMSENYTDRVLWKHYLSIAIPKNPQIFDAAHLWIEAGDNNEDPPQMANPQMRYIEQFATETGAVAAMVRQNPNQPVHFADEPLTPKREDAIIAKTWRHYIEWPGENPESDVIFQNPMTKTAVKAVDALIEIAPIHNPALVIDKIYPSGISKRGWIAWLLACVDQRVFATAPVVLSLLNWHDNLHHHNENFGGWSWAYEAYYNENVTAYIDHIRSREIFTAHSIDPYSYNTRMSTIPKLLQVATGDQFFLIDDSHDFWANLLGEKNYMLMWENADHGMSGHGDRMDRNVISFFMTSYYNQNWPSIRWENDVDPVAETGTLEMWIAGDILEVTAWQADNEIRHCDDPQIIGQSDLCRLDFRERTGQGITTINWSEVTFDTIEVQGNETYYSKTVNFRPRGEGYRAFYFQAKFQGISQTYELDLSTDVVIMPAERPFPRCVGFDQCKGILK